MNLFQGVFLVISSIYETSKYVCMVGWFNGISTLVGYLMPKPILYIYIYIYIYDLAANSL